MNEIYLRKEKQDYFVYILGKNGEAKANVSIDFNLGNSKYMMAVE